YFLVQSSHESIGGEFWTMALFPGVQLQKIKAGVGGGGVGQQTETGDRVVTLNPMSVCEDVIYLAHDSVGKLQGCSIRKLELDERISLVFFRNEAGGQLFAQAHGYDSRSHQHKHGNS